MSGHISPKPTYYAIFESLMVLTSITVMVAFINLGTLNFPVALGIAILKAPPAGESAAEEGQAVPEP